MLNLIRDEDRNVLCYFNHDDYQFYQRLKDEMVFVLNPYLISLAQSAFTASVEVYDSLIIENENRFIYFIELRSDAFNMNVMRCDVLKELPDQQTRTIILWMFLRLLASLLPVYSELFLWRRFSDAQRFLTTMCDDIKRATKRVYLTSLYFTNIKIANAFRQSQAIEKLIIVDEKSDSLDNKALNIIDSKHVRIINRNTIGGLQHLKSAFCQSDGLSVLWLGSSNFSLSALTKNIEGMTRYEFNPYHAIADEIISFIDELKLETEKRKNSEDKTKCLK